MKQQRKSSENYILLPISKTRVNPNESPKVAEFFTQLQSSSEATTAISLNVRKRPAQNSDEITVTVLDSIDTEGAKLISISKEELANFRFSYPGVRIIPERFYSPAIASREIMKIRLSETQPLTTVNLRISNAARQGIPGVTAVFFSDFSASRGASGVTDAKGQVTLKLNGTKAERIYLYPEHSYWGHYATDVTLKRDMNYTLEQFLPGYKDALRYFYHTSTWRPIERKVKVGVIDTGIGPHEDLTVLGGKNLVRGEEESRYGDVEGHGTHVAGIIAAGGHMKGVAEGAELMSYRVFAKGQGASNFDIIKAIDQAIKDGCDLINMSLGEAQDDEAISSYIKDAYNAGILCFAANGNDNRGPVSFPAAYSLAIAVSAMGRKGTFPDSSVQSGAIHEPFGTDEANFIADFSNQGSETDLTAPGVGIISTYPGNHYAVMDGTSMSCPAAAGMAARILAGSPKILDLPRNQTRADEMVKYLAIYTKLLGFGANFEGKGMLYTNDELHSKI
ncbi:S8 family serine peptidase [Pedobacter sp. MC2016-15]|uniref:S8 family serine peptidase n=1 Tax=Pedobacter sp. MC2016-15 TaxID=2994473 RepID=UPI002245E32C|nr:S8 family serine peptidase [Pedobacter sp. MC2016-15]MCX2480480.1 S8 family serine peptidase [Pedobacter sp. MC2016-15]